MSDSNDVPAIVDTVNDMPIDFTVVANSPKEMEAAQRSLILWASRKIMAIKTEAQDAIEQLRIAKDKKWSTSAWTRQVSKYESREQFYRKIKAALEAGYYIVPPFPIDIFAIRTKRTHPKPMSSSYRDNHDQDPQILAIGEGRYVDPKPIREHDTDIVSDGKGGTKSVTTYYATEFSDVDFPFKLARSEIRDATNAAMAMGIFDRMGVLPRQRAPDPLVCGQILFPNQPSYYRGDSLKAVTFFVSWWLDTRTL